MPTSGGASPADSIRREHSAPGRWRRRRASHLSIALALLAIQAGLLAHLAERYSPTVDEIGHLAAGLFTWEFGGFDLFRVNPPLVRTIATCPVWFVGPETDWSAYRSGLTERPEWALGRDLMRANGERSFRYFTWARWTLIPLGLLGGAVCYRWAGELYGAPAGLTALALWCFSPTVLAYGALITPDLGAAAAGAAAGYTFWRWLRKPGGVGAVLAGVALGLVLLTKMTWIVLFPLWPLLWVAWWMTERRELRIKGRGPQLRGGGTVAIDDHPSARSRPGGVAAILTLGLYILNAGYGFDGTFQPLGDYRFVSRTLSGRELADHEIKEGGNRFIGSWLARVPVPLPRDYVTGMDLQKREFERGKWSYLRGEWRHGGWWWYYLYAAAVKEPLGTWCLAGMALIAAWKAPTGGRPGRDALVLLAPGLVLFVFVSTQTGFNRYLRYVLPTFPFGIIWASQAVRLAMVHRGWALPVCGALLWSVGSSLWVYPHSLSYFNETVGGPARGHEHLADANVDWGQDLFELRDWLAAHPEAAPVGVACQAFVPLDLLGLEFGSVPDAPEPGWFIVSRHDRHRRDGRYRYFDRLEPVDRIGQSMDVYHVTPDDVARLQFERRNVPDGMRSG